MIYKKKINLYLYAVTVEGFSINTIMNYKEELRLFSNYLQTPTVQVTNTDIRNYLALNPNFKKNSTIGNEIKRISARVSISKSLTQHVFRHTMAAISLNNGTELADLQSLLGHNNPATTLRFAKVSEERKQNAQKKIPPLNFQTRYFIQVKD